MAGEATKIPFIEAAAPSTPAASRVVIYAKSDGLMYSKDDAGAETLMSSGGSGSVATDSIWDAAGDLAVGTGANTAARLAIGATNGMSVQRVSGAVAWALPPGFEFDYVAKTSTTNITAVSEATADTIVTANAVTYDGSTIIWLELFFPWLQIPSGNLSLQLTFYDGSSSIGIPVRQTAEGTSNNQREAVCARIRITPSAASHTYSVRGFVTSGTGIAGAGAGGNGNYAPGYIRQYKA